jgi:hypothetical protein
MFFIKETKVIKASKAALSCFSRKSLRKYATRLGVERGRDKSDVITNLYNSGKANITITLGD